MNLGFILGLINSRSSGFAVTTTENGDSFSTASATSGEIEDAIANHKLPTLYVISGSVTYAYPYYGTTMGNFQFKQPGTSTVLTVNASGAVTASTVE